MFYTKKNTWKNAGLLNIYRLIFGIMLLSLTAYANATVSSIVNLDITMTHGITGEAYSRKHITLRQKKRYTDSKGKTRDRWDRISKKSDTEGKVQFQYPDNIGTSDADGGVFLNVFQLYAFSPISGKVFDTDLLTNAITQFDFKVGAPTFTVTLRNATTTELIANKSVTAWLLNADGSSRQLGGWHKTNASGQLDFELPDIGEREYFFKTKVYTLPVSSAVINAGNTFDFNIATTAIVLRNQTTNRTLSDVRITAHEKLPNGDLVRYKYGVKTNQEGMAFFDLPQLGEKQYIFRVGRPFGSDSEGKIVKYDYIEQPVVHQVGTIELIVKRQNDESNRLRHVLNRITFGVTPELLTYVNNIGIDAYIEEQLNPQSIDDTALRANVDGWFEARDNDGKRTFGSKHLSYFTLYQALYSKRQLQEIMTQFWDNHFNTDVSKTVDSSGEARENDLFRGQALGKFRDILAISAHSPMMLKYLDNISSTIDLPNENYARELMELHTLGVDGGYTENDIVELSKILSGWTKTRAEDRHLIFYFSDYRHNKSNKLFLGQSIENNGQQEGEQVLDMLASSPITARFICSKLAKLFVNDVPLEVTVQGCANVFGNTQGDIQQVVRFLLTSNEFESASNYHSKVKTPLEFVVGLSRAFNFENQHPSGINTLKADINAKMANDLSDMGMTLYRMPAPTGYPEVARKWVDSAQLKARVRHQNEFILDLNYNILARAKALGLTNAEEIVDYFLMLLLGNDFQAEERDIALNLLTQNGQQDFDVSAIDDTDLRSTEMNLLRTTIATIASFPSHHLQ